MTTAIVRVHHRSAKVACKTVFDTGGMLPGYRALRLSLTFEMEQLYVTLVSQAHTHVDLYFSGSYGEHGYAWWSTGPSGWLAFLKQADASYVRMKLAGGRSEFDCDGTIKEMKKQVVYQRRHQFVDAAIAREAWESVCCIGDDREAEDVLLEFDQIFQDSSGEYIQTTEPSAIRVLAALWPVVQQHLSAEIS